MKDLLAVDLLSSSVTQPSFLPYIIAAQLQDAYMCMLQNTSTSAQQWGDADCAGAVAGLPIGLQLMGQPWEEASLLYASSVLESAVKPLMYHKVCLREKS